MINITFPETRPPIWDSAASIAVAIKAISLVESSASGFVSIVRPIPKSGYDARRPHKPESFPAALLDQVVLRVDKRGSVIPFGRL